MSSGAVCPATLNGAATPYGGRTFIILNPYAGQEGPGRLRRRIGGAFAARSAPFDLEETRAPGHATELAREAARLGYRAICVVGGDGTLAEAATGLVGSTTPLALIPRGTANQVARNLGIPTALEAAVETAIHGHPTPMDLGQIGGRAFTLAAGAGFDAAVMAAATRPLKERWGPGAYLYAALKAAPGAAGANFVITADGERLEVRAVSVMIANVGALFANPLPYALPLVPEPKGCWRDGVLDVIVIAPKNLTQFASVLWRAARRRFGGDDRLIHFQARDVLLETDAPVAVQIDGDAAGHTPIRASVVHRGIRILTPSAPSERGEL
jgi:YegS/Rv2252/BmrU family lipid kinase